MKKLGALFALALALSAVVFSCKEEIPPPPHPIVGDWNLDRFHVYPPSGYSYWDDDYGIGDYIYPDEIIDLNYSKLANGLRFIYNNDNTAEVRKSFSGSQDEYLDGIWEIDNDFLTMDLTDLTFPLEYEVIYIEETEMVLSRLYTDIFIPNAVLDTLTAWTLEDQQRINDLFDQTSPISVDLRLIFER